MGAPQGSSENMKSPNVPMLTGAVSQARAITDAPVNFAACDGNNMPPRPQFRRLKEVPQPVEVVVPPFSNGSGMKASPSMSHSSPRNPPWPRMWGNPAREPDASPFLEPEELPESAVLKQLGVTTPP